METRLFLAVALVAILAAGPGSAEQVEVVISFNAVTVHGFVGLYDSPQVAHLDPADVGDPSARPVERPPASSGAHRPAPGAPSNAATRGRPTQPLIFAPGEGVANPSFTEQGFLVESFWAVRAGTPGGYFRRGHFHPPDLASGFEGQHYGNPNELHGLYIRSLDGKPFGVKSLQYRVTRNRELPSRPHSIEGFSNYSVNVLLARTFDPRWSIRGQFVSFPVGLPAGNDVSLPWWTLLLSGFEVVEQVYIASSASVDFDNIVLVRR